MNDEIGALLDQCVEKLHEHAGKQRNLRLDRSVPSVQIAGEYIPGRFNLNGQRIQDPEDTRTLIDAILHEAEAGGRFALPPNPPPMADGIWGVSLRE
jgi:hypothetical protein